MRPTPIPDAEVWEGAVRKVFAAPGGDLTNTQIAPVEALIELDVGFDALRYAVEHSMQVTFGTDWDEATR